MLLDLLLLFRSALARLGAVTVDSVIISFAAGIFAVVPILGPLLWFGSMCLRETYRARWGDAPSFGRALFGLRVISLSGPEQEASSLALRSTLPAIVLGVGAVFNIVPMIGGVFTLGTFFALAALPLQTLIGNGRTWIDVLANTQVIRAPN